MTDRVESMTRRLAVPVTAVVLGAAAWAAQAIGGDVRGGAISFVTMGRETGDGRVDVLEPCPRSAARER